MASTKKAVTKKSSKAKPAAAERISAEQKITVVEKENPHREDSLRGKAYALYKSGMTVADFYKACEKKKIAPASGMARFVRYDSNRGRIRLH
jgi:hypothetical protein